MRNSAESLRKFRGSFSAMTPSLATPQVNCKKKKNRICHPPSPGTIPQIYLCSCVFSFLDFRGLTKGWFSKRVVLADVPPERKLERGYVRICSPGTKTRTRARSPKPPFYGKPPFCLLSIFVLLAFLPQFYSHFFVNLASWTSGNIGQIGCRKYYQTWEERTPKRDVLDQTTLIVSQ